MRSILLHLAALIPFVAAQVNFNVIGYPASVTGSFGVSIDGKITKLTTTSTTFPLWSGRATEVTDSTVYKYVELDSNSQPIKEEEFSRTMQFRKNETETWNGFYGRQEFLALNGGNEIARVPLVYDSWKSSHSKIFDDDTQVATIHLMANDKEFEEMLKTPEELKTTQVDFRYINNLHVRSVNNVTFSLSGKSSLEFNKMAFKLSFDTKSGQSFYSRPSIKLRSESSDPTFIREKLYIDTLNAIGLPTQQGVWVRLYVNNRPIGLYLLVDDIGNSFVKQTIHQGSDNIVGGALWQMNAPVVESQADLQYIGPLTADYPKDCYKKKTHEVDEVEPMAPLILLMKDLYDFDPSAPGGAEYWNARIDLEGFLRNMAMEYLGGSWDAYWWSGSNYFMYFNPTLQGIRDGKWQWISTDFDGTFGDGDPTEVLTTYQTYADFNAHDRPMISKLILKNTEINKRFETIIKEIVGWAFKPEALVPRIEAFEKLLSKEVEWEYSIDRTGYPGKTNAWTIQDFHQSLRGPVKDMNLGVIPWIEGRAKDLQAQMDFKVEPGTPDRIKRPEGGTSDVESTYSSLAVARVYQKSSLLLILGVILITLL
ncbi:hypothetical protein BGZ76_003421 [Entomortierella beljakovae]|nr:hypothetical protein BGZ76_003421 [Entomortierella beljakovae]